MIVTTTNNIEGCRIIEYKEVVFGEVVEGLNFIKDFTAGVRDFFGGRSKNYENSLISSREQAISEMINRAMKIGANAIVGVKFDYETIGTNNSMMIITCSGTAVICE